ncbi:UNVERIFIED_CONTAM: hypothetical protein HDU68_008599 [Siphonaria sp. JEL0065]|nr:hypothetical protein HDU68_008599 [Siphonaria sp. JEL0065]
MKLDLELDALFQSLIPLAELNKSSESLFGPIETESAVISLKALDSLKLIPEAVDAVFEMYIHQSRVSDPKEARKLIFKSVKSVVHLLDNCSIMDRAKATEIFSVFQQRNRQHERYFSMLSAPLPSNKLKTPYTPELFYRSKQILYQIEALATSVDDRTQLWLAVEETTRIIGPSTLKPSINLMRDSLLALPSFRSAPEAISLINELCVQSTADSLTPEFFYRMKQIMYQLEALTLDLEDRTKMWLAVEVGRQGVKKEL